MKSGYEWFLFGVAGAAIGFGLYNDIQHAVLGFGIGLVVIPVGILALTILNAIFEAM